MILSNSDQQCCECGMEYSMPTSFMNMRLKDGKLFYCPAGHSQYFPKRQNELNELHEKNRKLEAQLRDAIAKQFEAPAPTIKRLPCKHCSKTFVSAKRRRTHLSKFHKENPQS